MIISILMFNTLNKQRSRNSAFFAYPTKAPMLYIHCNRFSFHTNLSTGFRGKSEWKCVCVCLSVLQTPPSNTPVSSRIATDSLDRSPESHPLSTPSLRRPDLIGMRLCALGSTFSLFFFLHSFSFFFPPSTAAASGRSKQPSPPQPPPSVWPGVLKPNTPHTPWPRRCCVSQMPYLTPPAAAATPTFWVVLVMGFFC